MTTEKAKPRDAGPLAGRLASLVQFLFAGIIAVVSAVATGSSPDLVPRWLVLFVVYSLPGAIGFLGVQGRRPWLLIAAGMTAGVGSVLAMSGVTLIFLLPAVLFMYGAARLSGVPAPADDSRWSGSLVQAGLALAILVLLVGAGASALLITDAACWTEYQTLSGVRIGLMPFSSGGMQVPEDATAVSCSSGVISARGLGLAGLLGGAALVLGAIASAPGGHRSGDTTRVG